MRKTTPLKTLGKGIAGALAIASGTSAYGAIIQVFPPPDLTNVPGGGTTFVNWDVNSDGINDFTFSNRYPNTADSDIGVVWQLNMDGIAASSGTISYMGPFIRYAFALPEGTTVGSFGSFSAGGQVCLGSKYSNGSGGQYYYGGFAAGGPNGSVTPGTFSFVGFRFHAADGTHYGWAKLSVNAGIIDLHTAAYESVPDTAIMTVTLDPLVPEPGTLALLAMGAVGVIGAIAKRPRGKVG